MDKQQFISLIKDGAIEGYLKYNILPSLTMAQAILESGWGKSHISNNLFGIKAGTGWTGKTVTKETKEYINGKWITVTAKFRAYDSFAESVADHAKLLGEAARYKAVTQAPNYCAACRAVYEAGYATDPQYPQKLIAIIEQNGLYQYDVEAKKIKEKKEKEADIPMEPITIKKEGKTYKGFLIDGVAYGEVRALFTSQGQDVVWRSEAKEVVITTGPLGKLREIKSIVEKVI